MPIIRSAKKALRQNKKHRAANLKKLDIIRKARREILKLAAEGKAKEAEAKLSELYKALDKAAKKGVIKPNAASRKKSRLAKTVNKAKKK